MHSRGRPGTPKTTFDLGPPTTYTPPPSTSGGAGGRRSRSAGGGLAASSSASNKKIRSSSSSGLRGGTPSSGGRGVSTSGSKPTGRAELLQWLNTTGGACYAAVPDLKDGILFAQILDFLTSWAFLHLRIEQQSQKQHMQAQTAARQSLLKDWQRRANTAKNCVHKLNWSSGLNEKDACHQNMNLVREILRNCVPRQWTLEIDPLRLSEGKLQDLMIFLQWLYGYSSKVAEKYPLEDADIVQQLKTPVQVREEIQQENPSTMLRPELMWTSKRQGLGNRMLASNNSTATGNSPGRKQGNASGSSSRGREGYDPNRYAAAPQQGSFSYSGGYTGGKPSVASSLSSPSQSGQPHHRQQQEQLELDGKSSHQVYLQPLLDHLERNEKVVEEKIILHQQRVEESEQNLRNLTQTRDKLRSSLEEIAAVINAKEINGIPLSQRDLEMRRVFQSFSRVFQ